MYRNTSGGRKKLISGSKSAHFWGLAYHANYLYYSDWNEPVLMRIDIAGADNNSYLFGDKVQFALRGRQFLCALNRSKPIFLSGLYINHICPILTNISLARLFPLYPQCIPKASEPSRLSGLAITSPVGRYTGGCSNNNGGCSHLCLPTETAFRSNPAKLKPRKIKNNCKKCDCTTL